MAQDTCVRKDEDSYVVSTGKLGPERLGPMSQARARAAVKKWPFSWQRPYAIVRMISTTEAPDASAS